MGEAEEQVLEVETMKENKPKPTVEEMDGFDTNEGIILIAATNRPDVLDPAIKTKDLIDKLL